MGWKRSSAYKESIISDWLGWVVMHVESNMRILLTIGLESLGNDVIPRVHIESTKCASGVNRWRGAIVQGQDCHILEV